MYRARASPLVCAVAAGRSIPSNAITRRRMMARMNGISEPKIVGSGLQALGSRPRKAQSRKPTAQNRFS
jgi:hypothetical protein